MTQFRGLGAFDDGSASVPGTGTVPLDIRKDLAGLFVGTGSSVAARAGVLPGGRNPLVVGIGSFAYQVGPAHFVTSLGASDGVQLYGNDGNASVGTTGVGSTVPVAPSSGLQRIDIIWTRHPTNSENGDSSSAPLFGVTSGAAASTAVAPTIPAGAMELARNLMTSGATSTLSAGNTITQTVPYASLRGATVLCRNSTERDVLNAYASTANPIQAWRADSKETAINYGIGWTPVVDWSKYTVRYPLQYTGLTNADTVLTDVIAIPALPVPYRVVVRAMGQSGGAAGARLVAWGFDSHDVLTTGRSIDTQQRVNAASGGFSTVVVSEVILMPANVDCTFRLMSRSDNNTYNSGSLIATRDVA